jgi:hypothetical protein
MKSRNCSATALFPPCIKSHDHLTAGKRIGLRARACLLPTSLRSALYSSLPGGPWQESAYDSLCGEALSLSRRAIASHIGLDGTRFGVHRSRCAASKSARMALLRAKAPVAQLDRALPSEGRGHRFESCRVRQRFQIVMRSQHT